ncbi:MAG: universal stress protein [Thermodesulfobacteriota bacterium]|nr:universal stress protein [Thermodesulfobacteriota bacterium]
MLKKVLFPVKGKESPLKLMEMAGFLKIFNTESISIVNVGSGHKDRTQSFFKELKSNFTNLGFKVEIINRQGQVVEEILACARESRASFICFAYKRKSPLKRALFGDITTDVIRLSDVPVFVYKSPPPFQKSQGVNRVMYTTGLSDNDIKILDYLKSRELKADRLLLFHAGERAPDPAAEAARTETVYSRLSSLEAQCMGSFSHIETRDVVASSVTQSIVRQAKKSSIDFIIIGKSDRPSPFQMMIGSTAETLPRKASCPVLIIPGIYEGIIAMDQQAPE